MMNFVHNQIYFCFLSRWIIEELDRHRPLLGDCLTSFASCFPVAFFEPEFSANNKHASNVSQLSPEAHGKTKNEFFNNKN